MSKKYPIWYGQSVSKVGLQNIQNICIDCKKTSLYPPPCKLLRLHWHKIVAALHFGEKYFSYITPTKRKIQIQILKKYEWKRNAWHISCYLCALVYCISELSQRQMSNVERDKTDNLFVCNNTMEQNNIARSQIFIK